MLWVVDDLEDEVVVGRSLLRLFSIGLDVRRQRLVIDPQSMRLKA